MLRYCKLNRTPGENMADNSSEAIRKRTAYAAGHNWEKWGSGKGQCRDCGVKSSIVWTEDPPGSKRGFYVRKYALNWLVSEAKMVAQPPACKAATSE